jgi:hypothetical protein
MKLRIHPGGDFCRWAAMLRAGLKRLKVHDLVSSPPPHFGPNLYNLRASPVHRIRFHYLLMPLVVFPEHSDQNVRHASDRSTA